MYIRNSIAVLWIFLLGFHTLGTAMLFWWYQLERTSFSELLCENLDKPELQCHGSCQVRDMLRLEKPSAEMTSRVVRPDITLAPMVVQGSTLYLHWCSSIAQVATTPVSEEVLLSSLFRLKLLKPPMLGLFRVGF